MQEGRWMLKGGLAFTVSQSAEAAARSWASDTWTPLCACSLSP